MLLADLFFMPYTQHWDMADFRTPDNKKVYVFKRKHIQDVRMWHDEKYVGEYQIAFAEPPHAPVWGVTPDFLDPVQAQCIIYQLTLEGNDAAL